MRPSKYTLNPLPSKEPDLAWLQQVKKLKGMSNRPYENQPQK